MGLVTRLATVLLGSVALSGLSVGLAAAQNQNTKNVTLLERLVIGSGAAKVAIDTPQAVTVVDQKDIDDKQASTTGEIFDDMPGVTMVGSERALGESFNIRGIGAAETSGDEARIIITVDGAKKFYEQYRMGSFFSDPELYKQVEVLRGPASSTLYGAGAFGGVVNFTTKDASDFIKDGQTGAVRVKGSYSSNGSETLTSAILAHRLNETFEILAAGNFRRSDLQKLANGTIMTGSDFKAWSGLLKGTMHLDDEQVVRLSYQRWDSDADNQYYSQTGDSGSSFGTVDRHVVDQTTVLSYENPDSTNDMLDLKAQLSYSDTAVVQENARGQSQASSIYNADYGYKTLQASVQNTSTFTGGDWINYLTYGVQGSYQTRVALPETGGVVQTHPEGTSSSIGIFAQTEHTVNDALTLTAGARGDYSYLDPSDALATKTPNGQFAFSPKVAALYRFNDNINVFGSAAHTERMPTLDEMFQYQSTSQGPGRPARTASPNLTKEMSNNFEAGVGFQGFDALNDGDTFGVKATVFYNDITDGIVVNPATIANQPYFVNIAGMRLYGLELEGSYESETLFARIAYTLTRGEYTKDVSSTLVAGSAVASLPQDKVVLTVGGRLPEHQLEYGAKVTVAANPITYYDNSTGKPDGWAKLDLFANWKPQDGPLAGIEAQFGIDNVFDADYRENLSADRSKGRTFKLTLAKQFDY
jgi:hemoglobin/transferrin/lactoferrin receptor protein